MKSISICWREIIYKKVLCKLASIAIS